ncbi:MAG: adenine deaminase [Lachnospirales bacterium]
MYPKLENYTKEITDVAMGRKKADLIIKNVKLINTCTSEIQHNINIAIINGLICYVGEENHIIGLQEIDGTDYYASPGFMDGHMHIESSMLTPEEYANTVIPHGTTSVFYDPHEIANVLGKSAIELMIERSKNIHLKCFLTTPSCVPALDGFETNGKTLTANEINSFYKTPYAVGLGEMMNIYGVINNDEETHKKLSGTLNKNKIITGHYTISENDHRLDAYIGTGIRSCHESITPESILAKIRKGMYGQIRQGSAWQDLKTVIPAITENNISTRYINLVSDDTHPNTLIKNGHMNYIVNMAMDEGVDPISAIEMVTLNVANCFNMEHIFGSITPSKVADIILFKDIRNIKPEYVIINGEIVYNGKLLYEQKNIPYPDFCKETMNITKKFTDEDFKILCYTAKANVNIIEIIENSAVNKRKIIEMKPIDNHLIADCKNDIAKIFVIDRHSGTNEMSYGFIKGFSLKEGSIVTTVGHDAHNITVIGMNDRDIAIAVNKVVELGGGMVAVKDGDIIASVPLKLAGLMSFDDVYTVEKQLTQMENAWVQLGSNIHSPFMTLALTPLAVIPEVRLTNKGLVDVINYKFIDLIEN